MIYAFCYLFLLLCYVISNIIKYRGSFFLIVGSLPSIFVVVFRGLVGVDSAHYYINYNKIINEYPNIDFEPGFKYLLDILASIIADPQFMQSMVSCLIGVLSIFIFSRFDKKGFFFVSLFYPVFYFELTMNAVRWGIAFCIFAEGFILYKNKHKYLGFFMLFSSLSIHMLTVLFLGLTTIKEANKKALIAIFAFCSITVLFFYDRIINKITAYDLIQSPSYFSGIAPLGITILFLGGVAVVLKKSSQSMLFLALLVSLSLSSFLFSRYSYAGLRFIWLILLFSIFYYSYFFSIKWNDCKNKVIPLSGLGIKLWFFGVGFCGFIVNYKYYLSQYQLGDSPFLPYHFFWE